MVTPDMGACRYRIVVEGELSGCYSGAFEGMQLELLGGKTLISGVVDDQSRLHGLLERVANLGLTLVSVERLATGATELGGR
jgi:hypothetical protein